VAVRSADFGSTARWLLAVSALVWFPIAWWALPDTPPHLLFASLENLAAAVMFTAGAIIANATAVGGGMVFNPTLQLAFGVGGFSALFLSVLVQCFGMSSGCYGWYRRGQFARVERRSLATMVGFTAAATLLAQLAFVALLEGQASSLLGLMRAASAAISLYVARVMWTSRAHPASRGREDGATTSLRADYRLYPWLALGSALNVATAVGTGELAVSHLVKYYRVPHRTAVAIGTSLQATSVLVQGAFVLALFASELDVELLLVGLLFCLIGGRVAPFVLSHPRVEPWVRHILAGAALCMGLASAFTWLSSPG
jgi:hypothetical protein